LRASERDPKKIPKGKGSLVEGLITPTKKEEGFPPLMALLVVSGVGKMWRRVLLKKVILPPKRQKDSITKGRGGN